MNRTIAERGLSFAIDPASGVPFYRQIIQQIEHAVLSGRLEPGDRLPTIRALAIELKINPNTIAKAYGELEIRGILLTQVGSGTFVSDKRASPGESERAKRLEERTARFIRDMETLGADRTTMVELVRDFKED
ncbi:MAG TPA: GntR family transcriptional regulator [Spirochaetales bacterium]|nr:GntR family transcriptional regulator [Spirochaetales bacterium]